MRLGPRAERRVGWVTVLWLAAVGAIMVKWAVLEWVG